MEVLGDFQALLRDTHLEKQPGIKGSQLLPGLQEGMGELGGVGPTSMEQIIAKVQIAERDRIFQAPTKPVEDGEVAVAPFEPARGHGVIEAFFAGEKPADPLEMNARRETEAIEMLADLFLGRFHAPTNVGLLFAAEQAVRSLAQIEPQVIFRRIARHLAQFVVIGVFGRL